MKKLLLSLVLSMALLTACSDDDAGTNPTPIIPSAPRALLIVNEGNFQRSNASISVFLPDSGRMYNDVFTAANGRPLGDVGQSVTMWQGLAYVVVNNSQRIEVLDPATWKSVHTITCAPGASPRSIAFDGGDFAYISNLYHNSVSVYDVAKKSIVKTIPVGVNPEGLLKTTGAMLVANSGLGNGNTVSVVNLNSQSVDRTLRVGDNPVAFGMLPDGSPLLLCAGAYNDFNDPNDDTPASLLVLDKSSLAVKDSIPLRGHPTRLAQDANNMVYVLDGSVARVDISTRSVTQDFIAGWFYGIIVDTQRNRLYLTDALDYVQPGALHEYDMNGTKLATHVTGIIPSAMAFTK